MDRSHESVRQKTISRMPCQISDTDSKSGVALSNTVYKAMEQIDRHSTLPESGIAWGFLEIMVLMRKTARKDTP